MFDVTTLLTGSLLAFALSALLLIRAARVVSRRSRGG